MRRKSQSKNDINSKKGGFTQSNTKNARNGDVDGSKDGFAQNVLEPKTSGCKGRHSMKETEREKTTLGQGVYQGYMNPSS